MRMSPYIQSSAMDISTKNARKRFDDLEADLAAIGATVKHPVMMVHDEVNFDITCPPDREAEAAAILEKHFPR